MGETINQMQVFLSLIALSIAGSVADSMGPAAPTKSTCYVCTANNSVDKMQDCYINPTKTQQCTTNNGCFIKRREMTDEYGDVTKYTIQRGCVDLLVEGTGCYDGKQEGDLGADKKGEQCRYECSDNLCNSSFGVAVSFALFALMSLLSL